MNESEKYYALIRNWHAKASEEDYFSKFIFEYLAFEAYLKTQWKTESEIKSMKGVGGRVKDRDYIQALKKDGYVYDFWTDLTRRSTKDKGMVRILNELVLFLKKEPLQSNDVWWNFTEFDSNQKPKSKLRNGIIHRVSDIENIIEFWCSVRNNLFHGDKNPSLIRDQDLVRYAFITLHFFMENIFLKPFELHRVYPASWEDFWHRFKKGEAEVTTKPTIGGAVANIYECMSLEDFRYPILLLDKKLTRADIVEVLNVQLMGAAENADELWEKIKPYAGNKKKEYFGRTLDALNKIYGLNLS